VITRLNPIIRGWSAYYRTVVSNETFSKPDKYVWILTYKWGTYSHSNKSRHWVVSRYFGTLNRFRRDRWVFGDRERGAYLFKFAWTKIVRHQLVPGMASPDDPDLAAYWAKRRQQSTLPVGSVNLRLLRTQHGRCSLCGGFLLFVDHEPQSPAEWEQWLTATRKALRKEAIATERDRGGTDETVALQLVHADCQRRRFAVASRRSGTSSSSP
jgi:RNA-directed DNA polymerase